MAIGTPVSRASDAQKGVNHIDSGSLSAVTPGNRLIILFAGDYAPNMTASTLLHYTDATTDVPSLDASIANSGNVVAAILSVEVDPAKTPDYFTMSQEGTGAMAFEVLEVSDIDNADHLHMVGYQTGNGSYPNASAFADPGELGVGVVGVEGDTTKHTLTLGTLTPKLTNLLTQVGTSGQGDASNITQRGAYDLWDTHESVAVSIQDSGSTDWAAVIAWYKPGGPAGSTISPSAIASAEALPSATLIPSGVSIAPSAVGSTETIGSATLSIAYPPSFIQPTSISSSESVSSPVLIHGGVQIQASSITSSETIGILTLAVSGVSILPTAIGSAEAIPSPAIASSAAILPSAIVSAESISTPSLAVGGVTIQPTAISSVEAFGTATVGQIILIQPTGIPSGEVIGGGQGDDYALGRTPSVESLYSGSPSSLTDDNDSTYCTTTNFGNIYIDLGEAKLVGSIRHLVSYGANYEMGYAIQGTNDPSWVTYEQVYYHDYNPINGLIEHTPSWTPVSYRYWRTQYSINTSFKDHYTFSVFGVSGATLIVTATISPTGISSLENFGTSTLLLGSATIAPTAIDSAEIFGTPNLAIGAQLIQPTFVGSTESVSNPVLLKTSKITPTSISSTEALGTATLQTSSKIIPTGIGTSESVPISVLLGLNTLQPSSVISAEDFGTTILTTGPVTIIVTGIGSVESVQSPFLITGTGQALPVGITTEEAFGTVKLVQDKFIIPNAIASAETFGTAELIQASFIIPSAIESGESLGDLLLIPGVVFIGASAISPAEVVSTPALVVGTGVLLPSSIASAETFGTATILQTSYIIPTAIDTGEIFGTPALTTGPVSIQVNGITTGEGFGTPGLITGAGQILVSAVLSQESVSQPSVLPGSVTISPTGIATSETVGSQSVLKATWGISPTPIGTQEALGLPTITVGEVQVLPDGVTPGEALGTPVLRAYSDIQVTGITTEELLGLPELGSFLRVIPESIAGAEVFGLPVLTPGMVSIIVGGIDSQEAVPNPAFANALASWKWVNPISSMKSTRRGLWPVLQDPSVPTHRDEGDT